MWLETACSVACLASLEMSEVATLGLKQGAASSGPNSVTRWELFELNVSACLNNVGRKGN